MNIDLSGKTAIVCGSTQGIGRFTAESFSKAGAKVVAVARNEDRLQQLVTELSESSKAEAEYVVADFSDPAALKEAIEDKLSSIGPAEILVNNTGGPPGGPIVDADLDAFELAFTQHLKCNHLLAQSVIPGMKTAGYGRIINVISTSVKQPLDGLGVSNTTRGAVANWAKTMANELGKFGITVNNVLPGATSTQRLSSILQNKAEKTGLSMEEVEAKMKSTIPAARFAAPEEIAYAITFLASEFAGYITGVNLPVDGGRTKCL